MYPQLSLLSNPAVAAIAINTLLLGIVALLPKKLLTPSGIVHAWILGVLVWVSLQDPDIWWWGFIS